MLNRHAAELDYVVLDRVLDPKHEPGHREALARVGFNQEALGPWTAATSRASKRSPLVAALLRWLEAQVARHLGDAARATFQVRLYGEKGWYLVSRNLRVERPGTPGLAGDGEEGPEAGTAAAGAPVSAPVNPRLSEVPAAWEALFASTERLADLSYRVTQQQLTLLAQVSDRLDAQLAAQRETLERMADRLVAVQQSQANGDTGARAREQHRRDQIELIAVAVEQIASIGETLASQAPRTSDEARSVIELFAVSPELGRALADSRVRRLLAEPAVGRELAQWLLEAAARAEARAKGSDDAVSAAAGSGEEPDQQEGIGSGVSGMASAGAGLDRRTGRGAEPSIAGPSRVTSAESEPSATPDPAATDPEAGTGSETL